MSVDKDIRWELLARMCPNCTGTLHSLSTVSISVICLFESLHTVRN